MPDILIVEDDQTIHSLIRTTLTSEGYHCESAYDGAAAADCLEQRRYDLVLLDLMLPEISGYDLLEYI